VNTPFITVGRDVEFPRVATPSAGRPTTGSHGGPSSLEDAVPEVRRRRGVEHLGGLEPDVLAAKVLEHSVAAAEEHAHEMDPDLVDQPGRDVLPADARPAHYADVLVTGGDLRLLECALDAVGDERVHPPRAPSTAGRG
jgi:hypothetical protein